MTEAQVTRRAALSMQVCIPAGWSDEQAIEFAEADSPCGTTGGWQVRRQGDPLLTGHEERVCCESRPGFVHLMLDA